MTDNQHEQEQALIAKYHANALQAAELQAAAQQQALEQAREKTLKDAAATARNAAVAGAVNIDKALVLEGRPTVITETRDGATILRELKARVPGLIIDTTAEELRTLELPHREHGHANAPDREKRTP